MTGFDLRPHGETVSPDIVARFRTVDTATIGHISDCGYLPGLRPLFRPVDLVGPAVTVRTPGLCGGVIREALILARPGDVLVIEMVGNRDRACWGELRTTAAQIKGVAGVVIIGSVTDSRAIRALGFPTFAAGVSAITTQGGSGHGAVNVPLEVGATTVTSGDLIVGDDDGLFAIRKHIAHQVIDAAEEKFWKDQAKRDQMKKGGEQQAI